MLGTEWWRRVTGWLMAAGVAVSVAGCATGGDEDQQPEVKTRPVLVGRVASVPKDQDFVLLQSYGAWSVPPGVPVYCAGADGRLANLLPTGEKMGQFLAADLRDGEVRVGDAVYYRPDGREQAKAPPGAIAAEPEVVAGPEGAVETNRTDSSSGGSIEPELPR